MNFEPQRFLIGLTDFFSILLPGELLTYLLMGEGAGRARGTICEARRRRSLGRLPFASFSWAPDLPARLSWLDEFYDLARRYTLNTQIALLARRGGLLRWPPPAAGLAGV